MKDLKIDSISFIYHYSGKNKTDLYKIEFKINGCPVTSDFIYTCTEICLMLDITEREFRFRLKKPAKI